MATTVETAANRFVEWLVPEPAQVLPRSLAIIYGGTLLLAFLSPYELGQSLAIAGYLWAVYTIALAIGFLMPTS